MARLTWGGPMGELLETCKSHGVAFGTTASGPDAAAQWVGKGAVFFETEDARSFILSGASQLVRGYRERVAR